MLSTMNCEGQILSKICSLDEENRVKSYSSSSVLYLLHVVFYNSSEYQHNSNNLVDRVNNIDWKQKYVNQLERFYRNAPIEIHCNSSNGFRIENSKIYHFPELIPSDELDDSYNAKCSNNNDVDDDDDDENVNWSNFDV
ncbi:unnamed protein product [Schistosoma turkestanicum]|nr:unnamed protein product [Schistosoma turkestanicum]